MGNKIPKFVIITKGTYKGYAGFYKGKRANKLVIELNTGKEALVNRDEIIAQEGQNTYIDISPKSEKNNDIVLESPRKLVYSSKTQSVSADKSFKISNSKSKSVSVSGLSDEINALSKSSSDSKKMLAKAYVDGRVFEKNYIDNAFSFIFRDFLEKIGKEYSTDTINSHLLALDAIESYNSGNSQKRTRKILVVAYVFVIFNQEDINIPYNPLYKDLIRPNDNPEYILSVASKINYIRDVDLITFNKYIEKVLSGLSIILNKKVTIKKAIVYNRLQSSVVPRIKNPLYGKLSPLRLQNYNKNLDIESKTQALKDFKTVIENEIKTGSSSEPFKVALQTMGDKILDPGYILAYKNNKIEFAKELAKWYELFIYLQKHHKDNYLKKPTFKTFNNREMYQKIKDMQVQHLQKGLSTFSQKEYNEILSFLVSNYDTISSISFDQIKFTKKTNELYSNQDFKLKNEAIVTLNLKINHMYNRNIAYIR